MGRNLVMCLDGTAGQVRGKGDSNSVRLYELLDFSDETAQLAYYDPGVGTFSSPGAWTPFARWFSRMGGLIWGAGLRENLGDAYLWLMRTWQPGDRIYVFGFSRGAFTARALTGMLRLIGLMRPGSENQLQYAIAQYARRGGEKAIAWDEIHRFSGLFARQVDGRSTIPVEFLGVWDTVKAMGLIRTAPKWPYTRTTPNALRIRHTHHDVMRKSMERESVASIPVEAYPIPPITGPAYAEAAAFKKACADSWKPDATDAWPVPSPAATWQGWQASQSALGQGTGSRSRTSSRSRRSAAEAGIVEARRRPISRRPGAIEYAGAAWASPMVARRPARAAVAE